MIRQSLTIIEYSLTEHITHRYTSLIIKSKKHNRTKNDMSRYIGTRMINFSIYDYFLSRMLIHNLSRMS